MLGCHVKNHLEAHGLQVSTSWAFLSADAGTGFSDSQSQGTIFKGKTKTAAHEQHPCVLLTMCLVGHHINGTRLQR